MITFYPPERVEKVLGVPWLIPLQLPRPFPDYICRVNHRRGVIYWHCWHFRGMLPPPALRHHLPVHPSLRLIPSINASRQAPGYRSPFPVPRPPRPSSPALLRPSPSFSIKGSCMGSSYLLLWICKRLLSVHKGGQVKQLLHALHRNDSGFGWRRGLNRKYPDLIAIILNKVKVCFHGARHLSIISSSVVLFPFVYL